MPTLLSLPSELQIHVLACLSTKERAGLPLVCKALNKLVNDPGSLLWEALDLQLTRALEDQALRATAARLLKARGQRTKSLGLSFHRWPDHVWRVLLPFFPVLRELALLCFGKAGAVSRDSVGLGARECSFILRTWPRLQALTLDLNRDDFTEAMARICELGDLTTLKVKAQYMLALAAAIELKTSLQPLRKLVKLRHLSLDIGALRWRLPADLPEHCVELERLYLRGKDVRLPATLSKLDHLTALDVGGVDYGHLWPLISSLQSLKELGALGNCEVNLPSLHPVAFSTGLTGLSCTRWEGDKPLASAAGGLLALPALQALDIRHLTVAGHLDYGSLTCVQAFTCCDWTDWPLQRYRAVLGLTRLTSLEFLSGGRVKDDVVEGLCQLTGLRSLGLRWTAMSHLPECMAVAKLTSLTFENNFYLMWDARAYRILRRMPVLQRLRICVCRVEFERAVGSRSVAWLRTISRELAASLPCHCHSMYWYPGWLWDDTPDELARPRRFLSLRA